MKKDVINYIWTDKKRTIFGLPISFTRYFLTEDKFITRKGFLSIEEDELDLYRVIDKKLVLPFGQRMFGCGTIVMNVKDVDTPVKEVKSIKAPRDVLAQLDKYIDDACLANLAQITVVHGKGTGALRKGLHNYFKQLKKQKRISGYRDGEYGEGDLGVTVVIL